MLVLLKAMILVAEKYIGNVRTVELQIKEEGKSYTQDRIRISGNFKERGYTLELSFDD